MPGASVLMNWLSGVHVSMNVSNNWQTLVVVDVVLDVVAIVVAAVVKRNRVILLGLVQ